MSNITLPRATVEQALEAMRCGGWPTGKITLADWHKSITKLETALAQQAEPDHETRAELAEQQVVQLAEERDHYRNLWQKAQRAEPSECSNTFGCRCPKHFVAQQAEPVEPVAKVELMMTGGNAGLATRIVEIDDHLRERLRPGQLLYTAPPQRKPLTEDTDCHTQGICQRSGYGIGKQAEPVAGHVFNVTVTGRLHEWEPTTFAFALRDGKHALYTAPPQQAEPVEPVAWVGDPSTQDYASTVPDPQIEDRLARHGINPCPDCRGIGYDASGQLCWCQQNPSF